MGTIFLVSTPIGNLEDITFRAVKLLLSADIIACEDTRRTGMLIHELEKRYGITIIERNIKQKLIRYDNFTEQNSTIEIITAVEAGNHVALISDAGTPLLSDPGFYLIREAIKRNLQVKVLPGASAMLAALVGSGLPLNTFSFYGFPPEKQSHRCKLFIDIKNIAKIHPHTVIFYLSPHKTDRIFEDLETIFSNQAIVICRELTKKYEEVWRGTIAEAKTICAQWKGEMVLLFVPNS